MVSTLISALAPSSVTNLPFTRTLSIGNKGLSLAARGDARSGDYFLKSLFGHFILSGMCCCGRTSNPNHPVNQKNAYFSGIIAVRTMPSCARASRVCVSVDARLSIASTSNETPSSLLASSFSFAAATTAVSSASNRLTFSADSSRVLGIHATKEVPLNSTRLKKLRKSRVVP